MYITRLIQELRASQFLDNPGDVHWEAVKRIQRYLPGTKEFVHAFLIDGGVVSWSSKKQELVTLSTAEAEYVATTHAAKEAIWFQLWIK